MPELPEVETIRRILEPQLRGQCILAVNVGNPQVVAYPEAEQFQTGLEGQTIDSLSRRGKFLTLHFTSGDRLVLHLRMTGQLLVMPAGEPQEKHTHLLFALSGGKQLRYIDVRRFGRFWFFHKQEADTLTGLARLGVEPTSPALTAQYLAAKLGARKKTIKEMLHDQTIVAGIGNIYSDEILFAAGISPKEQCSSLTKADWERLAVKIREVILWGIDANAMTAEEYLGGKGKEYRNMPYLRVYGRAGQPCTVCRSMIEKATVGGRTSCYCPCCQEKKP
ncbi:MAG: bifunctional DNA-formamidopyrimidine glycosylase/DNA-(apurinic or apyrimidinic site) lyase [Eubacteriales bacterium]|nr:bifunctional DNA-formamidopyrimidine glycosylase/DNA-(apurinic or apyrimidinic site) lyase [Eubacteriales bacterium]